MPMIPPSIEAGIIDFANHGYAPGGFLYAVLTNNLTQAVGRADPTSFAALREICQLIYNEVPSRCWGSVEKVDGWIEFKQQAAEMNRLESVVDPRD